MARIRDFDETAFGQPLDHLLCDLARKHLALFGPDHQRGALDVLQAFPQVWDFRDGTTAGGLVDGRVEAEDEVACRLIEHQRSADLAFEELFWLPGIEAREVLDGLGFAPGDRVAAYLGWRSYQRKSEIWAAFLWALPVSPVLLSLTVLGVTYL